MNLDVFEKERLQFDALKKWTYLDHATFGLIPKYELQVMQDYLMKRNTEGINVDQFWGMWNHADEFRPILGKMIGCKGSEIVYGQSNTQLFNIFANGIGLKPGDNVVTTDSVYPADAYTILNQADRGVELRFAKTTPQGITPEELLSYADDHTRAVILCMVENRTGWRHDVRRIGELCHERNILLAVDATQCANTVQINVKDMHVDFLSVSLYKWMVGLQGHGFAYISSDLLPHLTQSVCGWVGSVDRSHNSAMELKLSSDAKKFELGGISFIAQIGMEKVVQKYLELGADNIENYILSLVQHVYDRSDELKRFRLNAKLPEKNRSSIVIFKIPSDMKITDDMLISQGIRARIMHATTIRTGFHYMNNKNDVDRLIEALKYIEKTYR